MMGRLLKWFRMPMSGLGQHFQTPLLGRVMPFTQYNALDTPVAVHLNMMQQCSVQNYGWPEGGSARFAQDIADPYEALGGEIQYRARVDKILVEEIEPLECDWPMELDFAPTPSSPQLTATPPSSRCWTPTTPAGPSAPTTVAPLISYPWVSQCTWESIGTYRTSLMLWSI